MDLFYGLLFYIEKKLQTKKLVNKAFSLSLWFIHKLINNGRFR